jgi:predicted transcriptional regulator
MYTNTEQKILELLLPQPFESYSVRAISEKIRVDYSLVHRSVRALIKRNIIKEDRKGHLLPSQSFF